jgi:transcriptional regulator with XRE-family HTH domain
MGATFGERLRKIRKNKKLTQKQLASTLKLAESTVSMYERDERDPSKELIIKIAELFEVSTDYLFGRTDDPTTDKETNKTTEEEFDDPELNIFFREIKEESPERREQLMKIWKIIKSESNNSN